MLHAIVALATLFVVTVIELGRARWTIRHTRELVREGLASSDVTIKHAILWRIRNLTK